MSNTISSNKLVDTIGSKKEHTLDYNPVYKVNYLVNGSIDTIFVFYGQNIQNDNEEEIFKKIFTDDENNKITNEKIKITFCKQQIHYDDSIGTIKIKILNELKNQISIDEIYLFSQKIETLNSVSLYQSLTQNKKLELTKIRLEQFLSNIVSEEDGSKFERPLVKDIYTFDDILEMKLDNKKYIINKVLGQKFFLVENEYPFICDPYDVQLYDTFF